MLNIFLDNENQSSSNKCTDFFLVTIPVLVIYLHIKINYLISAIVSKVLSNGSQQATQFVDAKQLSSRAVTVKDLHYYSYSDIQPSGEINSTDIPKDDRDAGGLPTSLTISKSTRKTLILNIYTFHGLVNGAMGYTFFVFFYLAVDDPVLLQYINVKFYDADIGRVFQDSSSAIPIIA